MRRAEEIAGRHYDIPASKRKSISVDTLLDWALRYRSGGFKALAPQPRQDRGKSRTITPQLADLIERLKRENPHRIDGASGRLRRQTQIQGKKESRLYISNGRLFLVAPLVWRSLQVLDARTFLPLWTFYSKAKESGNTYSRRIFRFLNHTAAP